MKNNRLHSLNIKVLIFCLIIGQSIGIRFFNGQGIFLSVTIILLSFENFKNLKINDIRFLFSIFLFLLCSKLVNLSFSFSSLFYVISLILSSYLFLVGYRKNIDRLQSDFFNALQIFVFHAFIGYLIYLLIPNQFIEFNALNKSFYNLFYVSTSAFGDFQRNTGLFWEPGVFQIVANFYLFYCIKFKKSNTILFIAICAVISSLSTSGFIVLMVNFLYLLYLKWKTKKIKFTSILLLAILAVAFIPIISSNVKDKINEDNSSGLVRYRDFNIGLELIKEKPLIGHGVFDSEYLKKKQYVKKWESNLFSSVYLDEAGEMGGGYTNGFIGLIAWYGIPASFLLYLIYLKNRFVDTDRIERFLFNLIMLISLISEPVSYTSLFMMFPFTYIIFKQKLKKIRTKKYGFNINYNNFI